MSSGIAQITTRDGAVLQVRPITPEDREALRQAVESLSPESRHRRFLAPVKELSPRALLYLTDVNHRDHEALLALTSEGEIVGVARYVRLVERPTAAEAAITVLDQWQGRGVGTELLGRLATRAREVGIDSFTATCFASNKDVLELFDELGAHMQVGPERAGVVELEVELPVSGRPEKLGAGLRAAATGRLEHTGKPPAGSDHLG